jgi:hypothetical protein
MGPLEFFSVPGIERFCRHSRQLSTRGTVVAQLMIKQAAIVCVCYSSPIKEGQVMSKATSTLIAALAALAMSGGAYAQTAGGQSGSGSSGSTAGPANQMSPANGATGGYGMPGATNSDSGTAARMPNSGLPSSTNSSTSGTSAPKSNNTLATPSVVSPAGNK